MVKVISAVIMAVAILFLVWWLPILGFDIFATIVVIVAAKEFSKLVGLNRLDAFVATAVISLLAVVLIFYDSDLEIGMISMVALLFVSLLYMMWSSNDFQPVMSKIGMLSFGMIYLSVTLSIWTWLRHLSEGRNWLILALVPACLCDTFAYVFGKKFGRRKFAPLVSPNKTWEGFFGALLGSLTGVLMVRTILIPTLNLVDMFFIALGLWIFSPVGDLIESLLKRSLQVKDSGNMIPGHGGILDRLDALVFSGPFVYFYLKYIMGV